MESLKSIDFKSTYDSYVDSPIDDFLVPALSQSLRYQRAVGFFSSALLGIIPESFTDFAERGGKISLICSPSLSYTDANAFKSLGEESLRENLNIAINNLEVDGLLKQPLDLMAALIRMGCLTVKFAIPYDPDAGMFHQKIGCFSDSEGNLVSFKGSNNESVSGWMELRNSEEFDVFTSWTEGRESERSIDTQTRFEKMWSNNYPGFNIVDFAESLDFIDRRSNEDLQIRQVKQSVRDWYEERKKRDVKKDDIPLYPYQQDVINNWVEAQYQGLVCFATGAGKTRTALAAIREWKLLSEENAVIILVPSVRLQKQWLGELLSFSCFSQSEVLLVGGDTSGPNWQKGLRNFTEAREHATDGIVIAIMDSSATDAFIDRVSWGKHLLVVADEVHNLGAPGYATLLNNIDAGGRLGLSATPNRYNDDENVLVREVFGADLKPVVDIPFAQDLGVLVQYRYRFETCQLSEDEIDEYKNLSKRIGMLYGQSKEAANDDPRSLLLKVQRANILKTAASKTTRAVSLLRREFKEGSSWLVFCNDTTQLNEIAESISDLKPLTYHQAMVGDPDATLNLFQERGGILLAIQMLDEGVDIPSIDHCLLIASSQNTRQFIQRRGRVLRANRKQTKGVAEIWDLIVVDEDGFAFTKAEIDRSVEFGRMAINQGITQDLRKLVRPDELSLN